LSSSLFRWRMGRWFSSGPQLMNPEP
jgi:hypothetical protein